MLVQISNGVKQYSNTEVFDGITFDINENEKIAVVGRNGAGKSTLLKVIANEESLDEGDLFFRNDISIGYLSQITLDNEDHTVVEEVLTVFNEIKSLEKDISELALKMKHDGSNDLLIEQYSKAYNRFENLGGYNYEHEMHQVLFRFGFDDEMLSQKINTLSGGERTKVAFVKLLLKKPDLLLLDEPTNHLDLSTIEWLEGYLRQYNSAMILISHDRTFLDNLVNVVWEIEYGKMKKYHGNYSAYEIQKKEELSRQEVLYANQQREIKRIEDFIERNRAKASKAKSAQSKIKYLERMDKIELENVDDTTFKANFEPAIRGGKKVLEVNNLKVGYDDVLSTVNLLVNSGDRIGIVGDNGTGKSTLIQTLMDQIPALGGEYLWGYNIQIGYFDQKLAQLSSNKTVLDEIWDEYPQLTETEVRTLLGNFLFKNEDVFKNVNVLSGGEKVRLSLLKIMLTKSNCLVLDEPTNHLDILGKDALAESLMDYTGTIIFVSHDRSFINKIANRLLVIKEGQAEIFEGNYDDYRATIIAEEEEVVEDVVEVKKRPTGLSNNQRRKYEQEMNENEERYEYLKHELFKEEIYLDHHKVIEIEKEMDAIETRNLELLELLVDE